MVVFGQHKVHSIGAWRATGDPRDIHPLLTFRYRSHILTLLLCRMKPNPTAMMRTKRMMMRAKMENLLGQKMNLSRRYGPCSGTWFVSDMTLGRLLERLTCTETPAGSNGRL